MTLFDTIWLDIKRAQASRSWSKLKEVLMIVSITNIHNLLLNSRNSWKSLAKQQVYSDRHGNWFSRYENWTLAFDRGFYFYGIITLTHLSTKHLLGTHPRPLWPWILDNDTHNLCIFMQNIFSGKSYEKL